MRAVRTSVSDWIAACVQKSLLILSHPVAGEMDVKLGYAATIRFADGLLVAETLEIIKLKVAETLAAFKAEFE